MLLCLLTVISITGCGTKVVNLPDGDYTKIQKVPLPELRTGVVRNHQYASDCKQLETDVILDNKKKDQFMRQVEKNLKYMIECHSFVMMPLLYHDPL